MTPDEIKERFPLKDELDRRQISLRREGKDFVALCPMHLEESPSFHVHPDTNRYHCFGCGADGTIIDLVMGLDGLTLPQALEKLGGPRTNGSNGNGHSAIPRMAPPLSAPPERPKGPLAASYDYHDEYGKVLYQVRRFNLADGKKTFQQCQWKNGEWVYKMEGARMVLFNLPAVAKTDYVWIVEGEKDALTLEGIKMTATTIAGGAKAKWAPGYSESLRGKNLLICGDNDEAGKTHIERIQAETKDFARTTRIIEIPPKFKDVTEYRESFSKLSDFADAIVLIAERAEPTIRGFRVPIKSMEEMERGYQEFVKKKDRAVLSLSSWLPSLGCVRPLVGGELVTIVADTGVGKTMILQNIALHTRITTLLFEVELPDTLTFERFAGMATKRGGGNVYSTYAHTDGKVPWKETGKLDHIHTCGESRISPEDMERIIELAGIKIGTQPALVLVDYIQLIQGKGRSRYERASEVAEEMKIVAKKTGAIIVMASQIARKEKGGPEITLHDAKDSGSIENSSGLVLGAWRDPDPELKGKMWIRVLKNTKGFAGKTIPCQIREDTLLIDELTDEPDPQI